MADTTSNGPQANESAASGPLRGIKVMLRISGFGQSGPMREVAGFGAKAESMGGVRYVSGFPDRPPVRMNLWIDVALYELVFNLMESTLPEYSYNGTVRERTGTNLTGIVPSNT